MNSEKIFIKEDEEKPIKKKRVLTEKQLEGLRKGREKVALKRQQIKEKKINKDGENLQIKEKKTQLKDKKVNQKKQHALNKVIQNASNKKKLNDFEDKKYEIMSNLDNENSFNIIEEKLKDIPKDIILDHSKLIPYLTSIAKELTK